MDERSSLGTVSKRGCFFRNARARNAHVEATSNHPRPAQAAPDGGTLYLADAHGERLLAVDVSRWRRGGAAVATVAAATPGFRGFALVAARLGDGSRAYVAAAEGSLRAYGADGPRLAERARVGGGRAPRPDAAAAFWRAVEVAPGGAVFYGLRTEGLVAAFAATGGALPSGAGAPLAGDGGGGASPTALQGHADGPGAAARFARPHSMALAAARGELVVSDCDNRALRRVRLADGATSTVPYYPDADRPPRSARRCAALRWPALGGRGACAAVAPAGAAPAPAHRGARDACRAAGARLCSGAEALALRAREAGAAGVDFWTSGACEGCLAEKPPACGARWATANRQLHAWPAPREARVLCLPKNDTGPTPFPARRVAACCADGE